MTLIIFSDTLKAYHQPVVEQNRQVTTFLDYLPVS
jgi:hypothetical protein